MSKKPCKFTGFSRYRSWWWSMSKETCKFTGFPGYRSCWWSISKEICKFTGFPGYRSCWWSMSKEPCKDFPNRSKTGGYAVRVPIRCSLSDLKKEKPTLPMTKIDLKKIIAPSKVSNFKFVYLLGLFCTFQFQDIILSGLRLFLSFSCKTVPL